MIFEYIVIHCMSINLHSIFYQVQNPRKKMLEGLPFAYNGIGLILEIIGLVLLLNPIKIINVRPEVFQSKGYFAFKTKNNDTLNSQSSPRIYNVGIFVIILGLIFQFIAIL